MQLGAWWWLVSSACTYVSPAEYEEQLLQRDEDQDGVTVGEGDCDDFNAAVSPRLEEIPYDGLDNDCGGDGDLADVDGDGRVAEQVGGDDCDDDDPMIGPGVIDEPYDGIDADCARDNDYDADRDGVILQGTPRTVIDAYQTATGATFEAVYGDCNDDDPSVFPGSPEEVPYDGVDSDCDDADDFDADGDGVPIPDDCLDLPDAALPMADPAQVYPGATDAAYDGIDSDCNPLNEFDLDGDGFVPEGDFAAFEDYVAFYGLSFVGAPGDCNDTDASVHPAAMERLGDAIDQNCDTDENRATFAVQGIDVVAPTGPRLLATPQGFVLVVGGSQLLLPTETVDHAVLIARFDPQVDVLETPSEADLLLGPLTHPPTGAMSLIPAAIGIAVGQVLWTGSELEVLVGDRRLDSNGFGEICFGAPALVADLGTPLAGDLRFVAGEPRMVSCADNSLILTSGGTSTVADLGEPVRTCFQDLTGQAVGCTDSGCTTFETQVGPPALLDPVADDTPVLAARQRDDLRAEALTTGMRLTDPIGTTLVDFPGLAFRQVDAVTADTEWVAIGITTSDELYLGWGPPEGPLATVALGDFDPTRPNLRPVEATLAVNTERVMIVVTLADGTDDVVAWTVYDRG